MGRRRERKGKEGKGNGEESVPLASLILQFDHWM